MLVKAQGIEQVNRKLGTTESELKKVDRAGAKMGDSVHRGARKAATGTDKMRGAAKAAAVGFGVVFAAAAGKAIGTTEELGKTTLTLSKSFGLNTKAASEWAAQAKVRGADGKALVMGFKALANAQRGAVGGSKAQIKAFGELGVSQQELAKHGNDLNWLLHRVSDGLGKLPAGTNKAGIQAKLFGRTWTAVSPIVRSGSKAMDEQLDVADKYGATFGGKSVKGLEEMIAKQREAKLAGLGLQIALGQGLVPILTTLATHLASAAMWFREHKTLAKILVGTFTVLAIAVTGYSIATKVAAAATGVWAAAQAALDFVMKHSTIGLIVTALAAFVAAVILAYKHSETFRNIVNGAWNAVRGAAETLWGVIKVVLPAIGTIITTTWRTVQTVTTTVWGAIRTFLSGLWGALRTVVVTYFGIYRTVITGVWTAVRTATTTVWGAIRTVLVTLWGVLRTVAGTVFGGISTAITTAWHTVQTVTTTVWGGLRTAATTVWNAIRTAVLAPIRAVRDALGGKDGLWAQMHGAATAAWEKIKTGAGSFAGKLKDVIVGAFEGAANKVIDFVNAIIGVINKIPGVPNIGKIDHIGGGGKSSGGGGKSSGGGGGPHGTGRLARGGMLVPGLGSGDKVPLHLGGRLAAMVEPGEFVSVANRNATAALMGVNSAVPRFSAGGILNTQEMSDLWRSKGGGASIADTMGVIGLVESGGKPWNVNPSSGAAGLWQILGQLVPGNLLNPGVNALNAIAKYKAQGLHAWDASRSKWEPLLGKAVGLDPLALIGQLPGVGGLPDWLKGTGRYVLSHVGKWIKDNVVKLIPGGGGGPTASGPSGVGVFEGVPMANWVIGALKYGRRHGAFGHPTSGYRPGFDPHTASGTSEHQGTRYPHGAVDFGGYHDIRALLEKTSYVRATAGYKYPLLAPKGFVDDGHASGTGHRRGGVLGEHKPFVGSYGDGGVVPRDGYGFLHRGEEVLRRDQRRGPLVNVENLNVHSRIDENSLLERLAFKVSTA